MNFGGQRYQVQTITPHENFNPLTHDNDIALIRVNGNIQFNQNVQPIAIASGDVQVGTTIRLAGWSPLDVSELLIVDLTWKSF